MPKTFCVFAKNKQLFFCNKPPTLKRKNYNTPPPLGLTIRTHEHSSHKSVLQNNNSNSADNKFNASTLIKTAIINIKHLNINNMKQRVKRYGDKNNIITVWQTPATFREQCCVMQTISRIKWTGINNIPIK